MRTYVEVVGDFDMIEWSHGEKLTKDNGGISGGSDIDRDGFGF